MSTKSSISVGGLEFQWELEKGQFKFEGQDSVLFWISTAMRTFFDTIEEISGEEASELVFETSGFRQGLVVGEYFENMENVSILEASRMITNTYASAGWGWTSIQDFNLERQTLTVHLKDSWEYKINVAQGKSQASNFLPAHYAGIFTGLFKTNMWYKVVRYQLEGHDYSIIEYFPSEVTVTENIHQLARKKEAALYSRTRSSCRRQNKGIKERLVRNPSPIIPVLEGVVVVPLIGKYDEDRSEELVVKTLKNLPTHKANYLILDLTGLDKDISQHTVSLIDKIGSAASLIGSKTILRGNFRTTKYHYFTIRY